MIYLYHGEDFVSSRNNFNKEKDKTSVTIDAAFVDKNLLNQLMSESSLFDEHKKVFIENLFGRKAAKNFDEISNFLQKASHLDVHIWSDKTITKTQLKDFPKYEDLNYKIPQNIFGFVDSITPNSSKNVANFHNTLAHSEAEFIFSMIVRQFRLMLGLLENSKKTIEEVSRLKDWQTGKLKRQATSFGEINLKNIYKKLQLIDKSQKTGSTKLSLIQAIDMLLLEI